MKIELDRIESIGYVLQLRMRSVVMRSGRIALPSRGGGEEADQAQAGGEGVEGDEVLPIRREVRPAVVLQVRVQVARVGGAVQHGRHERVRLNQPDRQPHVARVSPKPI